MVLCMIPAAFADATIENGTVDLTVEVAGTKQVLESKDDTNSITAEYNYEDLDDVITGKFTEDRIMALVKIEGLKAMTSVDEIYIDGELLEVNDNAEYAADVKWNKTSLCDSDNPYMVFPIELTKAGYSDTFNIRIEGKGKLQDATAIDLVQTVKVTVKLVNTSSYKNGKTAAISKIESSDRNDYDAYIVGSKIYLDFVAGTPSEGKHDYLTITFKDNNGDLFDVVTWAYQTDFEDKEKDSTAGAAIAIKDDQEYKLKDSAADYDVWYGADDKKYNDVVFKLETANAIYETKAYDIVVRTGIKEADPQGIYFAENTKTIKIGEEYSPVVMGIATNKRVDANIKVGTVGGTASGQINAQVVDIDGDTLIGTQEGTTYIVATYQTNDGKTYTSSSMKVTVTAGNIEDDDDDTTDGKTYMVTASSLRVRSGAGTNFSQIGSLKNGATVKVESIANGWAKLENGGYVSAQYLAEVVDNGEAQTMYVTARTLNVRKGPGTSYAKVGTLSRGTAVQVVGFSGNWAKLSNGYYVSTSYLAK